MFLLNNHAKHTSASSTKRFSRSTPMRAPLVGTLSMAGKCLIFVVLYMIFSIWQLNHYGNLVDTTWKKRHLEGNKQEALISALGKPKRIQEEHPYMVHADGTYEYLDNYYILYYFPKNPL